MRNDLDDWLSADYYAQVILTALDHAPLLAISRLARLVKRSLSMSISLAPGALWGYVVLPDAVRLVVGPTDDDSLDRYVEQIKTTTTDRLLESIRRADDDTLDMVLRYTPVWGGAIYQVWQAGYQRQSFWTEYRLSNALYELAQAPVEAGLAVSADRWPYTWMSG